jgi:hypothetical protein
MATLLNPKVWITAAIAVLLIAFAAFFYRAGAASERADFDAYKLAQAEQRALADRAREHRNAARQAAIDKEARHAQDQIAALGRDLATSHVAGQRVRDAIRAAADAAGRDPRAAGAGQGESSADPLGMFAKLLERADARAERVSEYADRLAIAGQTCERSYDASTPAE